MLLQALIQSALSIKIDRIEIKICVPNGKLSKKKLNDFDPHLQ